MFYEKWLGKLILPYPSVARVICGNMLSSFNYTAKEISSCFYWNEPDLFWFLIFYQVKFSLQFSKFVYRFYWDKRLLPSSTFALAVICKV